MGHKTNSDDIVWEMIVSVSKANGLKPDLRRREVLLTNFNTRLRHLGVDPSNYPKYLSQNHHQENNAIVALLTIHYTYFFREIIHYEYIRTQLIPQWRRAAEEGGPKKIRILSAACSTGQEAFSAAMILENHWRDDSKNYDYEIVGFDLDHKTVAIAKNAVYPWLQVKQVPSTYIDHCFVRGSGDLCDFYKVKATIQKRCHFDVGNILTLGEKTELGQFDFVFCRNVFLYFDDASIKAAIAGISARLTKQGDMAIGLCETISHIDHNLQYFGDSIYGKKKHKKSLSSKNSTTPSTILRVLCVDDSPTVLTLLKRILNNEVGFEVVATAADGEKALELLKTIEVDAITLDLHMPNLDGFGFLERFPSGYKIPIIVVSALERNEDGAKVIALGACDYVQKPTMTNLGQLGEELRTKLKSACSETQSTSKSTKIVTISENQQKPIGPNTQATTKSASKDKHLVQSIQTNLPKLPTFKLTSVGRTTKHQFVLTKSETLVVIIDQEQKTGAFFKFEKNTKLLDVVDFLRQSRKIALIKLVGNRAICEQLKDLFASRNIKTSSTYGTTSDLEVIIKGEGFKILVATIGTENLKKDDSHKPNLTINHQFNKNPAASKIKVLIVDDSATIRQLLRGMMARDTNLEIIGDCDGIEALESVLAKTKPDIITLDLEMPGRTGLDWLKAGGGAIGIPVVIVSALEPSSSNDVIASLAAGAVDYFRKPSMQDAMESGRRLCELIKVAAGSAPRIKDKLGEVGYHTVKLNPSSEKVIFIGASTGGTIALSWMFERFGQAGPPIIIAQHIPQEFSKAFADQLARGSVYQVREAQDGDILESGVALVAPGGSQTVIAKKRNGSLVVHVFKPEKHYLHNPSVDVLFHSAATFLGKNAIGILLTGMGQDGAEGLLAMRHAGAKTIVQDQESSIVFGMPRVALERGAADMGTSLLKIPAILAKALG